MMVHLATIVSLVAAASTVAAAPAPAVPSLPVVPSQDPFYQPPAGWKDTAPGTILKNRTVIIAAATLVPVPVSGYQLLYRTNDGADLPIVTVTTIMVPKNADPLKLVAYASAEDAGVTAEQALMEGALAQGWIVTLLDYEGPNSAYVSGPQEGKGVLDGVRATLAFSNTIGLSPEAKAVLWGYSGGAIAVGWAEALLNSYAPDLKAKVIAAATGGTPASLEPCFAQINGGFQSGLIVAALTGLAAGYPAFSKSMYGLATPKMKALIADVIATKCGGDSAANDIDFFGDETYFTSGSQTLATPAWQETFAITKLGTLNQTLTPTLPIHMYHAIDDEFIPYTVGRALAESWCGQGANLEFVTNVTPGLEHIGEQALGAPGALQFFADRFNGVPFTKGCTFRSEGASIAAANGLP
ncbi:hypothetical protein RQP46_007430 [Phenoliferia psychrophenolica]